MSKKKGMSQWTIITNHGLVLAHIWKHPSSTIKEVALAIKVTEWTVYKIIVELESAGYLVRRRVGRSNIYSINTDIGLRHETTCRVLVGDLLDLLAQGDKGNL